MIYHFSGDIMKLYEKIYNELKEEILTGEYTDGALLPPEKELQKKYEVSRITVQHAYKLLEEQGFVQRIPGKGTVLKPSVNKTDKQIIGVVICDFDSSFGEELIKSIEITAKEYGYRILLARSFDNHENESKILSDFISLGVSGIIIQNCHGAYTKNLVKLYLQNFPVVSVDRFYNSLLIPSVSSDNCAAGFDLTGYLLKNGHSRVLFASSNPENTSTLTERLSGFQKAFMQTDLASKSGVMLTDLLSPVIRDEKLTEKDIEKIADTIKKTGCTAIVASEYFVAELCEKAREKHSLKFEIVCFDHPDTLKVRNIFSHIRQNEKQLGSTAVHRLCSIINEEDVTLRTFIPSELVLTEKVCK